MIEPYDEDEREELLRELLLERFGPVPYWEATFRPRRRTGRRSAADRRRWLPSLEPRQGAA